ncbi:MAG: hypothetical protein ACRCYB_11850 [Aeromonas veronii]
MNKTDIISVAAARYSRMLDTVRETGVWDCSVRNMWDIYLMLSHRYYVRDESLIPDSSFDTLCQILIVSGKPDGALNINLWDDSALRAGTGFHTVGKIYPLTTDIAEALR